MPDDYGMQLAEESLEKLERKYRKIYSQAAKEMREKQRKFLKEFEHEKAQRLASLDGTEEAEKAYKAWLREQTMGKQWMNDMVDELSRKATEANEIAVATLLDQVPGVYAGNANYEAYAIEKSLKARTAFTLVSEDVVRNLVTERGSSAAVAGRLLPEVTFPKVDRPKDYRWNRQKFTSAITQGILQGESIPNIVKRTESVFGTNEAAAYRAARTAVGSAQNSGRYFSMLRAEDMGIVIKKKWKATHDGRTRDSHVELDGAEVPVEEPFESEHGPILYPKDPAAHPSEVWNCRCTIEQKATGFKPLAESYEHWLEVQGMSYQEWEAAVAGGKTVSRFDFDSYTPGRPIESMSAIYDSLPQRMKDNVIQDYEFGRLTEAEYAVRTMQGYTSSQWEKYRYDGYLDSAIMGSSEHFEGPMFRGMRLWKEQVDGIEVGGVMRPKGVQSWSREHGNALDYCDMKSDGQAVMLVDVTKGKHTAVSIEAVSQYEMEREVLSSASIEYEVVAKYEEEFDHFSLRTGDDKLRATVIEVRERKR